MQLGNLWFLLSLASLTAWEKEVRRMQGVTGLTMKGSCTQNVCSIKEGVPGTEVSLHSTNSSISALGGTVLIVNQCVTASTASASPSPPFSGVVRTEDDRKRELMKGEDVRQESYPPKCKTKGNTQIKAQVMWWHGTLMVPGEVSWRNRKNNVHYRVLQTMYVEVEHKWQAKRLTTNE